MVVSSPLPPTIISHGILSLPLKVEHAMGPHLQLLPEPGRQCELVERQWARNLQTWLVVLALLLTNSETLSKSPVFGFISSFVKQEAY